MENSFPFQCEDFKTARNIAAGSFEQQNAFPIREKAGAA